MAPSSSTSSFNQYRWLLYIVAVAAVWAVYFLTGQSIADFAGSNYGSKIVAATKHRILDPSRFVEQRLFEVAYLITVAVAAVALIDAAAQVLRLFVAASWRFLPLSLIAFMILNGACHFAGRSALPWMACAVLAPSLRKANTKMGEQVLWQSTDGPTGMIVGSSQANAQLGVTDLNQMLDGAALFADESYHGGHPMTVLMLQSGWQKYPDVTVWYLSMLDLLNHKELGAAAQPLMTEETYRDFVEFGGDKLIGPTRMRYARIGTRLPLFKVRRSAEAALFSVFGTPGVASYEARRTDPTKKQEENLSRFYELMTQGRGDIDQQKAIDFQIACLRRAVERFDEHDAKLMIIAGHVNPTAESMMEDKRGILLEVLQQLEDKHKNLTVIRDELPRPSAEQYRDLTHLDEAHRPDYTKAVLDLLRIKGLL